MPEIKLTMLRKTPVFYVDGLAEEWGRIYGATKDKARNRWLFPAVPPFRQIVLRDIENVYSLNVLSPDTAAWIAEQKTLEEWRQLVETLPLLGKKYDHQLDGMAELLYNYRWVLNWKMGTGKTKIAIDAMAYLKIKTLVLCPLIAVGSWEAELRKYAGDTLKVFTLDQTTATAKRNGLRKAIEGNFDVLIATYDITRTLGYPHIDGAVNAYCKEEGLTLHDGLRNPLKQISISQKQLNFVKDWRRGRKPADIRREVEELLKKTPYQWIHDFPYDLIVGDESHRIKNYKSLRTQACKDMAQKASRRILLTGTLSQGNPWDLYPQLRFLAPYVMPEDVLTFHDQYFSYADNDKRIVVGYKNLHILNKRVSLVSSVRTLEECVQLPSRQFIIQDYELSSHQKASYNQIVTDWAMDLPENAELRMSNGAIRISKLLQICSGFVYLPEDKEICDSCPIVQKCVENSILPGSKRCAQKDLFPPERGSLRYGENPKLSVCKDLLTDLLASGKVIIWAVMRQELDDLELMLKASNLGYVRIDGRTTARATEYAARFNTDSKCVVYLAQISTGIAITLNAARYTVYYSRSWSEDQREQSLARNYRIGQEEKTVVYDLCGKRTVEVSQLAALKTKEQVAALTTNRVDCAICSHYQECVKNDIVPWAPGCVYQTKVAREITKAQIIQER